MALAALLIPWLISTPAGAERRIALVAGNGAYANAPMLPNPVRDAQALAGQLRQLGFDVDTALDQGKAGMDQALRRFGRKLPGTDVALFFYAGHGLQIADRNYLVPVDAKLGQETDVRFETVELRDVIELIQSNARTGIVLLDACRNNPLASRLAGRGRSLGRGLAVVETGTGELLLVYATSPGMIADDGEGGNSPFTSALLDHIGTRGIEVQTVIKRVIGSVQKQTGGRQVPWQLSSLTSEIYLGGSPGAVAPAPVAASGESAEIAFWGSIQGSTDAADFTDYLKRYPNGQFATLARRRREALTAAASAAAPAMEAARTGPASPTPAAIAPPRPPPITVVAGAPADEPRAAPTVPLPPPAPPPTAIGTFVPMRSGTQNDLYSIWTNGSKDVWIGGHRILLRLKGQSWSKFREDPNQWYGDKFADRPLGDVCAIAGDGKGGMWANGAALLRWDGKAWQGEWGQEYCATGLSQFMFGTQSVWASAADDAWVYESRSVKHWDGKAWSGLSDVRGEHFFGTSRSDVWAWRRYEVDHWDGARWSRRDIPITTGGSVHVNSMWGTRTNDIWAVGFAGFNEKKPVIMRWNGLVWKAVFVGTRKGALVSVWGSGPDDVWAVGGAELKSALGTESTLGTIMHWDGAAWSEVASGTDQPLYGVAGSGPGRLWVVGRRGTILRHVPAKR